MPTLDRPLRPAPRPSSRPWAGTRLAASGAGTGELWLAGPDSVVEPFDGPRVTLDALAAARGAELVGRRGSARLGRRFPLLVKVIDAADWLSLQLHPSDTLAAELYGPGSLGKAEAWVVLEADPEASLVIGPRRDVPEAELRAAIAAGTLGHEACESRPAVAGDVLYVASGTIHAIGPGTFLYEIEQPSDLTFRISDWGRPETPERPLHRAESLRALRADRRCEPVGSGWELVGGALSVRDFRLEMIRGPRAAERAPNGETVEVVTAIGGPVALTGAGWAETLAPLETLVVPAAVRGYQLTGEAGSIALVGSVP